MVQQSDIDRVGAKALGEIFKGFSKKAEEAMTMNKQPFNPTEGDKPPEGKGFPEIPPDIEEKLLRRYWEELADPRVAMKNAAYEDFARRVRQGNVQPLEMVRLLGLEPSQARSEATASEAADKGAKPGYAQELATAMAGLVTAFEAIGYSRDEAKQRAIELLAATVKKEEGGEKKLAPSTKESELHDQIIDFGMELMRQARDQAFGERKEEGKGSQVSPEEAFVTRLEETQNLRSRFMAVIGSPETKPAERAALGAMVRDLDDQIRILDFERKQALDLKQVDLQIEKFRDESRLRWAEFNENVQFRREMMAAIEQGLPEVTAGVKDFITSRKGQPGAKLGSHETLYKDNCPGCGRVITFKASDKHISCPHCGFECDVVEAPGAKEGEGGAPGAGT